MLPRLVFDDNNGNRDNDIDPAIRADLAAFDAAPDPQKADLSAFDKADPRSVLPAGVYVCRVESGKLGTTNTGKLCYKLRLTVTQPPEFAGRVLFKTVMLHDAVAQARAKVLLGPLGLTNAEALRRPFPPPGRTVFVKALVTIQPERNGYSEMNNVERLVLADPPADPDPTTTPTTPTTTPANPWAVSLDETGEGGAA